MSDIAHPGNETELLATGTFTLRRALDELARPVAERGSEQLGTGWRADDPAFAAGRQPRGLAARPIPAPASRA